MSEAASWILKKLDEWSDCQPRKQRWVDGDQLEYLGRNLTLRVVADAVLIPAVLTDEAQLQITVADPSCETRIRDAAIAWYRRHGARNFSERIAHYALAMQLPAPKLLPAGRGWPLQLTAVRLGLETLPEVVELQSRLKDLDERSSADSKAQF